MGPATHTAAPRRTRQFSCACVRGRSHQGRLTSVGGADSLLQLLAHLRVCFGLQKGTGEELGGVHFNSQRTGSVGIPLLYRSSELRWRRMLENQIIHFTLDFTENSNSESKKNGERRYRRLHACLTVDCSGLPVSLSDFLAFSPPAQLATLIDLHDACMKKR